MKLSAGYNIGWPTVVYKGNFEVKDQYIESAMVGGVDQGMTDIAIEHFTQYLSDIADISIDRYKYETVGWVNRYDNVGMEYHTHAGAHLSSVMYLVAEDGDIVFHDPRSFASRGYDMNFRPLFEPIVHKPKAGEIVIFPSFLYHTVRNSKEIRISCPIDLFLFQDD